MSRGSEINRKQSDFTFISELAISQQLFTRLANRHSNIYKADVKSNMRGLLYGALQIPVSHMRSHEVNIHLPLSTLYSYQKNKNLSV